MIAPAEDRVHGPDGRFKARNRLTPSRLKRICERLALVGSLDIAAPRAGVPVRTLRDHMKRDERVSFAIERALAKFLERFVRKLDVETDPVLAQSARYTLARRSVEWREDRSTVAEALDALAKLGKTVEFTRRPAMPPKGANVVGRN